MGQRTSTAAAELGVAALQEQLDSVCSLLREISGESFRLVENSARSTDELTELAAGWAVTGSASPERREAAAELLTQVLSSEREIESLCSEILDCYEEVTLIQRLGLQMGRTVDEEGMSQAVVREITDWLHARAGELWLRDGDSTRLAGAVPDDRSHGGPLGEVGPLEALSEGATWTQGAGGGSEAVVAIPLPAEGEGCLGVLVVRGKEGERSFEQREIQMLTAVAALASGYLRSHRLARASWAGEHGDLTSDLSRLLHPGRELSCQGLEISCVCRIGRQPGSDYHDVVRTPDGGIALNLARVCTGGARAAMHMALAKGVLQAEARGGSSPGRMLRRVNDVLSPELIRSDLFATAYVARFHPGGRRVDVASAGHSAPLLVRADGRVEEIDIAGPALGLLNAMDYAEDGRQLESGDVLVFFSDGLVDARNPEGDGLEAGYLGELVATVGNRTAEEIRDRLLGALDSHREGRQSEDDATLVVARAV